ncbi:VPLPA-CTERM sorting domain-containing protein [Oceanicoccus sp. KOV_DT_Chl]|uniref:VPLPA-CTERM sorting domain-containing protein n=1 Tax=Oceanicoccus sp. KOV_DT_Chl TaxID=1904639 RepID=UPI000C7C6A83|nr:VPLPA-CTERM sorting domain-containing protein [Oceanicoccus sp. KOV_DT_Chl]
MLKQFMVLLTLLFSVSTSAEILKAFGSGNNTFFSFDPNTADLTLIKNQGYYAMDFAPDGSLYAVDRAENSFYQLAEDGSRTHLTDVGYDDWGGGFTVSNDGQYAYWSNRASLSDNSSLLYRMNLSGGPVESLGAINGILGVSDIEFGYDGTLYAMSGMNVSPDGALYSIDLNTMLGTKVSLDYLGLKDYLGRDVGSNTLITSLNATAGGMNMLVKPENDPNRSYYMGTIDLETGEGSFDYSKRVTLNGGSYTAGIDVAFLTPVPVPAAAWLFGSALIGLVGAKRKK